MRNDYYVILYYPDLRVIGPFDNGEQASLWGRKWQKANGDNPCWNTNDRISPYKDLIIINLETPE